MPSSWRPRYLSPACRTVKALAPRICTEGTRRLYRRSAPSYGAGSTTSSSSTRSAAVLWRDRRERHLKIKAAFAHCLTPIVCGCETWPAPGEQDETWVSGQSSRPEGLTPSKSPAHHSLRDDLGHRHGLAAPRGCGTRLRRCGGATWQDVRDAVRSRAYPVGAASADNTAELMAQPNIDGALIGGATSSRRFMASSASPSSQGL